MDLSRKLCGYWMADVLPASSAKSSSKTIETQSWNQQDIQSRLQRCSACQEVMLDVLNLRRMHHSVVVCYCVGNGAQVRECQTVEPLSTLRKILDSTHLTLNNSIQAEMDHSDRCAAAPCVDWNR